MAARYYDDILVARLEKWIPDSSTLRVLKPEESKRLFELQANDSGDKPIKLPLVALSRSNDIELLSTIKSQKSYDGLTLVQTDEATAKMNVIPIKLSYSLDIYAKTYEEADEYVRQYLFKLINNPKIVIEVPYNGIYYPHTANIRVQPNISDTSDITEHIFSGQFTRWTIQFEVQDAFLFSTPYRKNWRLYVDDKLQLPLDKYSVLEVANDFVEEPPVESDLIPAYFKKV